MSALVPSAWMNTVMGRANRNERPRKDSAGTYSALHVYRTRVPLGDGGDLHILPFHRTGFLLTASLLDGVSSRRRTHFALLASHYRPPLRGRRYLDARSMAARHGY